MFNFLSLEPKAFGLDISDLSLKIANLKRKGKFFALDSWGETKMKPGIVTEGEIRDKKLLIEAIKKSLSDVKGEKLKTRDVIVSLPEKKAFFQVIQMPKMKKEELEAAIPFEAENYIPLSVEDVCLDFQIIPSIYGYSSKHHNVLVAAIPKRIVDLYISCIKEAGLFPRALEIESQSVCRALIKGGFNSSPVLLIDFGRSKTSFIIFSGYSLRFTFSGSISSQALTEAVSQSLKVSLAEAERLKIKYGLRTFAKNPLEKTSGAKKKAEENKIFEAMSPVLTDLIKQTKKYLDYYQTHDIANKNVLSADKKVKEIIVCGRGVNLNGLVDFLSSELKMPVRVGNPWVNILPAPLREVPGLPFEESLGYTAALGLALRGAREKID